MSFLTFTPQILSLIALQGSEWVAAWGWAAGQGKIMMLEDTDLF